MTKSKLISALIDQVEQQSRVVAELAAETGRYLSIKYEAGFLTINELKELADELGTEPTPIDLPDDEVEYLSCVVRFEKAGEFTLIAVFTAAPDDRLMRWRDD